MFVKCFGDGKRYIAVLSIISACQHQDLKVAKDGVRVFICFKRSQLFKAAGCWNYF